MKDAAYWRRRFELLKEATRRDASKTKADIEREFTLAQHDINKQINAWYARFADNNQISLAEARRTLSKKELSEFKWDLDEYIRRGKENSLDGRWIKELENASARVHISRLEELKLETRNTMETLYAKTGGDVASHLKKTYDASYLHNAFEVQKGLGAGSKLTGLDPAHIEKVLSKPWTTDGATFSDRIWNQKEKLIGSVHTHLTQNMILGRPPTESIDAIAKEFNASRSNASRLVMTESAFFAAAADLESFKALGVEHFEILATLDEKTCATCGALDGQHFPLSQYEIGVTAPPFHPNCYCTTVPWYADADADHGKRAARDADGKSYEVPADMTFGEWKRKNVTNINSSGFSINKKYDTIISRDNKINKQIERIHPADVVFGSRKLSKRQRDLLDKLPETKSSIIINKRDVSMLDLSALTAYTGDEFALFTRKGKRMIVRGNTEVIPLTYKALNKIHTDGYKWSGHTHPGFTDADLISSDGDKKVMELFNQRNSVIYNAIGKYKKI